MYNLLNGANTSYSNTFDLLAATPAKDAVDNFNNGNCTTNPAAFAIKSITYPYANLLDRLTTQEKQTFLPEIHGVQNVRGHCSASECFGHERRQDVAALFSRESLFRTADERCAALWTAIGTGNKSQEAEDQ